MERIAVWTLMIVKGKRYGRTGAYNGITVINDITVSYRTSRTSALYSSISGRVLLLLLDDNAELEIRSIGFDVEWFVVVIGINKELSD